MSAQERLRWDAHYRQHRNRRYPNPDPLLFDYVPPAVLLDGEREVRALDLACGRGQNGLWLAKQGYVVDLIDISREALMIARAEAQRRQIRSVNLLQKDLDSDAPEAGLYDVVCVFRFMQREILPAIAAAVRPGGRVIYQTYNARYLRRAPHFPPNYLIDPNELPSYFPAWEVLCEDEPDHITQFVGQKPIWATDRSLR